MIINIQSNCLQLCKNFLHLPTKLSAKLIEQNLYNFLWDENQPPFNIMHNKYISLLLFETR